MSLRSVSALFVRRLVAPRGLACLLALAVAGVVPLAMARDRHALRAAVAEVVEFRDPAAVASLRAAPDDLAATTGLSWRWDDPAALAPFAEEMAGSPLAAVTEPDDADAFALAAYLHAYGAAARPPDVRITAGDTEDPFALRDELAAGRRLECHAQTIVAVTRARALGWTARLVNLDGRDGLGGRGHTVAEVWLPRARRWVMIDALYGLAFRPRGGEREGGGEGAHALGGAADGAEGAGPVPLRLLSVEEIRAALPPMDPDAEYPGGAEDDGVTEPVGHPDDAAEVLFLPGRVGSHSAAVRVADYRRLTTNLNYFLNNAFAADRARRFGALSGTALEPLLDAAPRPVRRGFKRLLGESGARVHPHVDARSRPYRPLLWRAVLWGALGAGAAGGVGLLLLAAGAARAARREGPTGGGGARGGGGDGAGGGAGRGGGGAGRGRGSGGGAASTLPRRRAGGGARRDGAARRQGSGLKPGRQTGGGA